MMLPNFNLIAFFNMSQNDFSRWITSIWLIGVGVALGLIIVLAVWAVLKAIVPSWADRCFNAVKGPVLTPISIVMGIWVIIAVLGTTVVQEPYEILNSLRRLPYTGEKLYVVTVPESEGNVDRFGNLPVSPLGVTVDSGELKSFEVETTARFEIVAREAGGDEDLAAYRIQGGEPFKWNRGSKALLMKKLPSGKIIEFYARNDAGREISDVNIKMTLEPAHIEAISIFYTMCLVASIFLSYFILSIFLPKVMSIAEATATSEMSQLLFILCVTIGCIFMVAAVYIPYHTLGEDIKVLKHTGMQVMMILGIIVAIWASSTSIADEIEGKTALTLLSKPVSRQQFIIGKFIGIAWTVAVLFVIVSLLFLPAVASKPIFDKKEGAVFEYERFGEKGISWQLLHEETVDIVPGIMLAFMETIVLTSLSVAISTRLPMAANFIVTFGVYALGHLTPSLMQASVEGFEPVKFVASFLATILPLLKNFEIYSAIAAGNDVPVDYLGYAALYCVLYSALAMFLSLILFEDRDLA